MSRKKEFQVEVKSREEGEGGSAAAGADAPREEGGTAEQREAMTTASASVPSTEAPSGEAVTEPAEKTPSEEEKLRQSVAEITDRLLRTAAEFENYRKRVARQYDEMARSANERILLELLEIVDNFERALQHRAESSNQEAFGSGMELIFSQMKDLLAKYDVTPIEALGRPFDPEVHEAVMQVASEEYAEGVVAVEASRGYRLGNRVLRHSKVGVSSGKGKGDESSPVEGSD